MARLPARALLLPGLASLPELLRALETLGYHPRVPRRESARTKALTFYDTWNGALRLAGYLLWNDATTDRWVLRKGGRVIATEDGEGTAAPPPGALVDLTASLCPGNPFIPHLALELTRHRLSVAGLGRRPLRLDVRLLSARSVHRPSVANGLLVRVRRSGDPSVAKHFRSVLRERLGARACPEDLFVLGMDVLGAPLPGAGAPSRWVPSKHDGAGEMAAKVIGAQLHRLRASHAGAAQDLDPEYVHEMRVAARTARQALRLFRPWLDRAFTDQTARELAWLGGKLGAVRDYDVFLDSLRKELPGAIADPAAREAVTALVRLTRATALSELREALTSPRHAALMEELDAVASGMRGQRLSEPREDARAAGSRVVRRALLRIKAQGGESVEALGAEELHRMRILFRRLRYACELFRPIYGRRMRRALPVVVVFQDCLGEHQDAAVARERLLGLARSVSAEVAGSIEALADSKRKTLAASRLEFVDAWQAFPGLARRLKRCVGRRRRPPADCAPSAIA